MLNKISYTFLKVIYSFENNFWSGGSYFKELNFGVFNKISCLDFFGLIGILKWTYLGVKSIKYAHLPLLKIYLQRFSNGLVDED